MGEFAADTHSAQTYFLSRGCTDEGKPTEADSEEHSAVACHVRTAVEGGDVSLLHQTHRGYSP